MGRMKENVFELAGVCRSFGALKAVDDLTLSLARGEVTGFLGTNGAGKTTTIKMLIGLLRPTSGTVRLFGGDPTAAAVRARIGYMPETAYYYPYLNVRELLAFYGGVCGMDRRTLRTFSKGMLQRAGIAQALLHDPDLLVLDEPFTGLDPLARIHFRNLLRRLRDRGKSIFFSSHELGETELLCDSVAIMKRGRCIYHGPVDRLAGDGRGNLERLFLDVLEKGGVA